MKSLTEWYDKHAWFIPELPWNFDQMAFFDEYIDMRNWWEQMGYFSFKPQLPRCRHKWRGAMTSWYNYYARYHSRFKPDL